MIGPLPYIGGKNRLAKKIISMLPEHDERNDVGRIASNSAGTNLRGDLRA